jgi:hypothetical protein
MSNLDTLLDELSSYSFNPVSEPQRTPEPDLTEDKVTEFVVKSAGALVNAGLGSVNDLRELVIQGQNPDEIAALASLISSTAGAIEALNKLTLLQKKNEASKELKQMEIQGKKEIAGMTASNNPTMIGNTITNNVLVASRDEIMKQFLIEPPTLSKEVIMLNDNNEGQPQTPKETLEAIIANNT